MPNNRRDFLKKAAVAGAGMALYPTLGKGRAWAFAQSPTNLRKFVTSVPGLGPSAKNEIGQYIPLATKHSVNFAEESRREGWKGLTKSTHPPPPSSTAAKAPPKCRHGRRRQVIPIVEKSEKVKRLRCPKWVDTCPKKR
jgi:hypothetical protein